MGYTNITRTDSLLAQALTASAPTVPSGDKVSLWDIGNVRNRNEISDETVYEYIRFADDEIDSNLSEMYRTPLHKTAHGEWYLEQDIDEYNPDQIVLSDTSNLIVGDEIYIISTTFTPPIKEQHVVASIIDENTITVVEPIFTNFPAGDDTRVVRYGFPPAIVLLSTRKTVANIYDKYFAAQASPNMSEYGNTLRQLAASQMTDILNGVVILHGEDRIGNRFANADLYDRYQLISRNGNDSHEVNTK